MAVGESVLGGQRRRGVYHGASVSRLHVNRRNVAAPISQVSPVISTPQDQLVQLPGVSTTVTTTTDAVTSAPGPLPTTTTTTTSTTTIIEDHFKHTNNTIKVNQSLTARESNTPYQMSPGEFDTTQKHHYPLPAGLRPNLTFLRFIVYDTTPSSVIPHQSHLDIHDRDTIVWIAMLSAACFFIGILVATVVSYAIYKLKWRNRARIGTESDYGEVIEIERDHQLPMAATLPMNYPDSDDALLYDPSTSDTSSLEQCIHRTSLQQYDSHLGPRLSLSSGSSCLSTTTQSTNVSYSDSETASSQRGEAMPNNLTMQCASTESLLLDIGGGDNNDGFDFKSDVT